MVAGWTYVDESADKAETMARQYIGGYWDSIIEHYEFDKDHLKNTPGYEFHGQMYDRLNAPGGMERMTDFFLGLQVWGTPDEVTDRLIDYQRMVGAAGIIGVFSYGGMPHHEAETNMRLFSEKVLPRLKAHGTDGGVGMAAAPTAVASSLSTTHVSW